MNCLDCLNCGDPLDPDLNSEEFPFCCTGCAIDYEEYLEKDIFP
jgi:endogenous inhibitor of DNA gyrase (YacG/DUF329 family)